MSKKASNIRNIAIIAHVDHGKTTLVDCLLKQSGLFRSNQATEERMMDSMDLERERGITIKAKNASFRYKEFHVNIVDTPGHADFGGEVERIMNMIDGVILVVDAYEGPQAQTRFVLRKALESGARPIVVINKIDRENANPAKVVDQVTDLFLSLAANEDQLDFPVLYASARDGYAMASLDEKSNTIQPLFDAIVKYTPAPRIEAGDKFRILVSNLDYSDYLGRIAFGKILSGSIAVGDPMVIIHGDGSRTTSRVSSILHFDGLKRIEIGDASAGDIIGLTGCEDVFLGETIAGDAETPALPFVPVDPPTLCMRFAVNDGPLAGQEGKLLTARHIRERLEKEVLVNISLRFNETESASVFEVRGRGEMQIAVLVEQMRREGFELLVSRPEVIFKKGPDGEILEPVEELFCEVPNDSLGPILESLAFRKAEITSMDHADEMVVLKAFIPTRGLIGFETELVNGTRGLGIMSHLFHEYAPFKGDIPARKQGSLVSMESGKVTAYSLDTLQERARLMVVPGDIVYPGMIIGENSRGEDMTCNPTKEKKLTNMRSSGDGKGIILDAPLKLTLERALEYIGDDEYVEATPKSLRLRKKILDATERKRAANRKAALVMAE
jgi:GTP-binding protein